MTRPVSKPWLTSSPISKPTRSTSALKKSALAHGSTSILRPRSSLASSLRKPTNWRRMNMPPVSNCPASAKSSPGHPARPIRSVKTRVAPCGTGFFMGLCSLCGKTAGHTTNKLLALPGCAPILRALFPNPNTFLTHVAAPQPQKFRRIRRLQAQCPEAR